MYYGNIAGNLMILNKSKTAVILGTLSVCEVIEYYKRRKLNMTIEELKLSINVGLTFDKPTVQSAVVKVGSDGFYYSIGRNGNSKKITYVVLAQCLEQLQNTNTFSRAWFKEVFPSIEKTAPCSFTTIGGLFQYFNLASYENATYKKRSKNI